MFKNTTSGMNEDSPFPIETVEVNDAQQAQLAIDFVNNADKKAYVVCNVQDPDNKAYYMWNGLAWAAMSGGGAEGVETQLNADFALRGISGTPSTTFVSIPLQVMVPKLADVGSYIKVEAKLTVSHNSTLANTGEAQLYNYTDGLAMPTTNLVLPNASWEYAATGWVDITAQEGKALRVQIKRAGAVGQIQLQGANVILKYT
jgi:hypothetical protein